MYLSEELSRLHVEDLLARAEAARRTPRAGRSRRFRRAVGHRLLKAGMRLVDPQPGRLALVSSEVFERGGRF